MQCTVGIGLTAGLVGVMMTIICCKTLCEFLLELSQPDATQNPSSRTVAPTVLEMPIIIRVYLPQPGNTQQSKNMFEPLPISINSLNN
jgi:hypothetical protein